METISKTDCIKMEASEDIAEAFGELINELYEEINYATETYHLVCPVKG